MASDVDLHLGRRLKRRRRILGLTQVQLSKLVGVRFQQIQKYECGANRMSAERLWQLAGALEISTDYFYEGLEQPGVPANDEHIARKETAALIDAYYRLGEGPRRKFLELAKSIGVEDEAA